MLPGQALTPLYSNGYGFQIKYIRGDTMESFRCIVSILLCILFISGCSSVNRESGAPVSKKNAIESRDYFRSKSASGITEKEADIAEEAAAPVDKKNDGS